MNILRRQQWIILFSVALMICPTTGWGDYVWQNVTPANGAIDVESGSSVDLAATVIADGGSPAVPGGSISVQAPSGHTATVSFFYDWALNRGDFERDPTGGPSAVVTFSDPLPADSEVTVTFIASGNNSGGGQFSTQHATTFTVE